MTEHPLIPFLRARYDELAAANWHDADCQMFKPVPPGFPFETLTCDCRVSALVEADIAAKRKIVEWHSGAHECSGPDDNCMWISDDDACPSVRAFAEPFASHPDYPKDQP